MNYDRILSKTVDHEKIKYGILFGNEKIVFIKVGTNGKIRGHQDKYLRMAHRVHERIGATVICSSNPWLDQNAHLKADKATIDHIITELGVESSEMYFVGTSDGGYHSLLLAQQFSQTAKYLGINSSHMGIDNFAEIILSLSRVQKILVYGRDDEDFDKDFPTMNALACDNLEIVVLDGVDHHFTDKIDHFIALADLL